MSWVLRYLVENPMGSQVTMGTYLLASRLAVPFYLRIPLSLLTGRVARDAIHQYGGSLVSAAGSGAVLLLRCTSQGASKAVRLAFGEGKETPPPHEVSVDEEAVRVLAEELEEGAVVFEREPEIVEEWFDPPECEEERAEWLRGCEVREEHFAGPPPSP